MGSRNVAVGWPPLRTYRINSLVNQSKSSPAEDDIQKDTTKNGVKNNDASFVKSPMLVKVTMDGVIIGRKIDLNALDSYEALAKTLEQMFFNTPTSVTTSQFFLHSVFILFFYFGGGIGYDLIKFCRMQ